MHDPLKNLFFVLCLAVALCVWTPTALADMTVQTIGYYGPYQTGQGGEFTLAPSGFDIGAYVPGKTSNLVTGSSNFQTFCLEHSEYIYPDTTFSVGLSDRARNGGLPASSGGDPISKGTAYLYSQFAMGVLTGYAYGTATPTEVAARHTSAAALQNAIWWLEDEGGLTYAPSNSFEALVVGMFGSEAGAMADAEGAYGVKVLSLYLDANHTQLAQDQLVLVPVPEPASILGLGTFLFLIGAQLRRRKRS